MATVQTVGIREAKAHLSRYLHSVRQGNEIILTDRNRPVGKIVPIPAEALSLAERLRSLEEKGLIQPENAAVKRNLSPVPLPLGLAQALLQEDRNK
ncbi:type II toxin-antitoxin system Phd/YefM family antitoxin [Candidatus Electronema sp. JC]|uniref:type II toxin-antitoxin system Phd/YefM family antitoxin n=1 Tax=Candidatus Electronema sp. JC TaxID=3401570 RepID=UPI003AA9B5B1